MVSIRLPVLISFVVSLLIAGYLGFASIQLKHDKLIHFMTFLIITVEFYFIFNTNYKSLKTLRYITLFTCTLGLSIGSEMVQSLVNPSRVFDIFDILYNVGGSLLGLAASSGYQIWVIKKAMSQRFRFRRIQGQHNISNDLDLEDPEEEGYVTIQMKDVAEDP